MCFHYRASHILLISIFRYLFCLVTVPLLPIFHFVVLHLVKGKIYAWQSLKFFAHNRIQVSNCYVTNGYLDPLLSLLLIAIDVIVIYICSLNSNIMPLQMEVTVLLAWFLY